MSGSSPIEALGSRCPSASSRLLNSARLGSEVGRICRNQDVLFRTQGPDIEWTTPEAADGLGLDLRTAASRFRQGASCSGTWRRLAEMCANSDGDALVRILGSIRFNPSVVLANCANRDVFVERAFSLHGVFSERTKDEDVTVALNKFLMTPDPILRSSNRRTGLRLVRGNCGIVVVDRGRNREEDVLQASVTRIQ
jgi:hypothetical protein